MASDTLPPSPSLPEHAYQAIRRMILDLSLLPGQSLVVINLAQRLGMSRTPVREALVRLASEGLVENIPQKGTRVAVPTARMFREVYEIVEGIEGQAAKLAAERADTGMIRRLEESVAAQEAALAADDVAAWAIGDTVFHELIIEATGNQRMREVMRAFDGQMKRVRLAIIYRHRRPVQSVVEHRAVVEAIRDRDGERARRLHLAHRDRALREYELDAAEMIAFALRVSPQTRPESAFLTETQVGGDQSIDAFGAGGGFVLRSSHSLLDDVPVANVLAMFDEARDYGPRRS